MRKLFWPGVSIIPLCAMAPLAAAQGGDLLSLGASVQEMWDSNYTRTAEENSEHMTLTSASIALNKTLSRQNFVARWQGQHYAHAKRTDLDATLHDGRVAWQGEWGSRLSSNLEWTRDSYAVDRLEFPDKDIIKRDDLKAELDYGLGHKLSLGAGGRQTKLTHTNDLRAGLDFDEDEAFAEMGYKTGIKSTLIARVRYGERIHTNEQLEVPTDIPGETLVISSDLDFEYQQAELEATWVASPKTSITSTYGYFKRDGIVNDGSGSVVSVDANWEFTPKIQLTGGYSYKQPAVGETSDSPADSHAISFGATWEMTSKITVGTGASASEQKYEGSSPGPTRVEKLYSVTPLTIAYQPTESISIRLASGWTDRQSPLEYRDYTSAEGSVGLFFRY